MGVRPTDTGLDAALAQLAETQVDEVQTLSRGALNSTFVLCRLAMMHNLNNEAFKKPLASMVHIVNTHVSRGGYFSLKLSGDSFFVNNNMIRLDSASFTSAEYLVEVFRRLGMGSITATASIDGQGLIQFIEAVRQAELAKDAEERKRALVGRTIGGIAVRPQSGEVDPLIELKRDAQRNYAVLAVALADVVGRTKRERLPSLAKLKRLVQKTADLAEENRAIATALGCHFGEKEHHLFHPVNVSIFSILLGQAIGLDRKRLSALGLTALLHDVGTEDAPDDGTRGGEQPQIPGSVSLLTRAANLSEQVITWTVFAYEVGLYTGRCDLHAHGYFGGFETGVLARIVAVAHFYERMVNRDPAQRLSPHLAVQHVLHRAGRQFDPSVARAFLRAFGIFPVGTVVELDDGSKAIVVGHGDAGDGPRKPLVRILGGDAGNEERQRTVIDLGTQGARTIARAVPPAELCVNATAEVLF
ncbi:MAG: hypothetical protein PHU25_10570 [Deltaproteobacteria bacterium]|nr:hypothetical protein [Deltaproteobacteria bacterium]